MGKLHLFLAFTFQKHLHSANSQKLSAQATHLTQTVNLLVTTIKGANAKVASHDDLVPAPTTHSKKVVSFEKKKTPALQRADDETHQKLGDTVGF